MNGNLAKMEDCTDFMGFVPQDDIVYAELTVKENLIFAGKLKLPRGTPLEYISDLADDVIADLGLTRVANSMVGDVTRRGVSGGEKKRVNIGLELMSKPSILFLDKPTRQVLLCLTLHLTLYLYHFINIILCLFNIPHIFIVDWTQHLP